MKMTFKYIAFAAMVASAMLNSCTKEQIVSISSEGSKDGMRIISVTFDNSTKATLADATPGFQTGDLVMVSNATKSQKCKVNVDGTGNATFSTYLTGDLTAIYPADAAVLTGGDGSPLTNTGYKVPATQDGTLSNALIAKSSITGESLDALFTVQTALFEITPPSGATSFTVTSLNTIASATGRRSTTANAVAINTEGADEAAKRVINVTAVPSGGKAYVALVAGVKLTDLSFDAGGTYGMKGIPAAVITAKGGTDATAPNTKYSIDGSNWHPYVTIGGLKWATRNIGATADTGADSYGTYFSWGSVDKVYTSLSGITSSSTFTFGDKPSDARYTGTWTANSGFAACNTPYYNNSTSSYGTYTSSDGKAVLELADDAAYVNWGGPWRMPTGGTVDSDFTVLANACRTDGETEKDINPIHNEPKSKGVYFYPTMSSSVKKGLYFIDGDGNKLFFPATGYGKAKTLTSPDSYGYYWSSNLYATDNKNGYLLRFYTSAVNLYNSNREVRYYGYNIRPVADL